MKRFVVTASLAGVLAITLLALALPVVAERYMPEKVIGAGSNWLNGKAYFFKDGEYIRYTVRPDMQDDLVGDRADAGYPKPINNETWPGLIWTDVDAVVNWGNGKAYFFKGKEYIRYDVMADRADPGYPKPINEENWPGLTFTGDLDAVVNWGNGKAYFFKGGEYIRYDIRKDRADSGFPKAINAENWPGMIWSDGIDDVLVWGNGKAYFFKGREYIRYDIREGIADPGYPKAINNQTWPGLKFNPRQ